MQISLSLIVSSLALFFYMLVEALVLALSGGGPILQANITKVKTVDTALQRINSRKAVFRALHDHEIQLSLEPYRWRRYLEILYSSSQKRAFWRTRPRGYIADLFDISA